MRFRIMIFLTSLGLLNTCSGLFSTEVSSPESFPSPTIHQESTPRNPPSPGPTTSESTTASEPTSTSPNDRRSQDTPHPSSSQGYIYVPTGLSDAGNHYIYAGKVVELEWIDAPLSCQLYEFSYSDDSGRRVLIGADPDPSDGISIQWEVPAHVRGERLKGEALCEGDLIISHETGLLSSGDVPLDGVCVIASSNIGALDFFGEPSLSAQSFGHLVPGSYARVLERTPDGWYRVETMMGEPDLEGFAMPPSGWSTDRHGIELFGPCEDVPVIGDS